MGTALLPTTAITIGWLTPIGHISNKRRLTQGPCLRTLSSAPRRHGVSLPEHRNCANKSAVTGQKRAPVPLSTWRRTPLCRRRPREMRILRLILAGMLALSIPIVAHAHHPGSNRNAANTTPAIPQRNGSSSVSQPTPGFSGWQPAKDHIREWNCGWCPPHRGPNHLYGWWGPSGGLTPPTYWVWVPGSAVFDYPFSDWRGPHGGWGNP